MLLLLGLEGEDLAACALNADFDSAREDAIRVVTQLPAWEVLAMFISVGNFPSNAHVVPASVRYGLDRIIL